MTFTVYSYPHLGHQSLKYLYGTLVAQLTNASFCMTVALYHLLPEKLLC